MEVKINDATRNRPEGNRVVDAPAVFVDIQEQVEKLKAEVAWKKNDRNAITVFKSGTTTIVVQALHKDAAINDLEVDGLLSLQVIEGALSVGMEETEEKSIGSHQMMVFHRGPLLQVRAAEDSIVLLTTISG